MPVSTTHAEYDAALDTWRRNRDAVAGQETIKKGGDLYLPRPNAEDLSEANRSRYQRYLDRALWYAAPERTKNALIGSVFRKGPEKQELPSQIDYMAEDADGSGVSLEQIGKHVVGELLEVGRIGILAEYPQAEPNLSQEEVSRRNLRANLATYSAETIINWRAEKQGGKFITTLVVLKEVAEEAKDEFESEPKDQYRVLRLTNGVYTQQLYDDKGEPKGEAIEPRKSDGGRWEEIPFVVVGSENNRLCGGR